METLARGKSMGHEFPAFRVKTCRDWVKHSRGCERVASAGGRKKIKGSERWWIVVKRIGKKTERVDGRGG